jgi:hypothetical protein
MKPKRWLFFLGVLIAGLAFLARRFANAKATGLDRTQAQELLTVMQAAYGSTLGAFEPSGDQLTVFDERDATAATDAEALRKTFEALESRLAAHVAPSVKAFVEAIAAAQLQIMAFAINRKNRGLPDAVQNEAEHDDRQAFRRQTEPIYKELVTAFS